MFGHSTLDLWPLDPDVLYLNHGTVGVTPRAVLAAQAAIRAEIERRPAQFLLRDVAPLAGKGRAGRPRLRVAADEVAAFLGARGDDFAFTDNVTTAISAVLRSLPLATGDEIVILDVAYGAIALAAAQRAREAGATVKTVRLPYPLASPGEATEAIAAALGPRTRLLIVDHVTSETALVLPIADITARARAAGVPVLVDGAHAPGAIALDLPSTGADWYAANLHKWAWAPRSSGFLWAPPERHAGLHAPVMSWGLETGFPAEFDWIGTRDPSAWLAAPAAIAHMHELGVEAVRSYNHALAWRAVRALAARFEVAPGMPESMVGTMATMALPERAGATPEDAQRLRDALLFEDRIEVAVIAWRGRLWVRVSAQIYVEDEDVERLADAVLARLPARV